MFNNKTGIGPVIASGLLLVVAIVAVVTFQTWFNTYSTTIFSDVETQSGDSVGSTNIDTISNNYLYFKNSNTNNVTIQSVKVGGVDCSISQEVSNGLTGINISSCLSNVTSSNIDVVVITNQKVYSKKVFLKDISISNSVSEVEESGTTGQVNLTFTTNTSYIYNGSQINLTWSSSNADFCESSLDWLGSKNTSDSLVLTLIEGDYSYGLNCSNSDSYNYSSLNVSVSYKISDPYWDYVTILLQPNSSDSTVVDKSKFNQSLTVTSVPLSTSTQFSDYSSMDFDIGASRNVRSTNSSILTFGTGDYTIEAWINVSTVDNNQNNYLFDSSGSDRIVSSRAGSSSPADGSIMFLSDYLKSAPYSTNSWLHIAVAREGTNLRTFYNGALQNTYTNVDYVDSPGSLYVGNTYSPSGSYVLRGLMQSFRVTNGIARYTSSFTDPTEAFPEETLDYKIPQLIISTNDSQFYYGSSVSINITWVSNYTDYCTASGDWSGDKNTSGSEVISGVSSDSTFILTCSGGLGPVTKDIEVTELNDPYWDSVTLLLQPNLTDSTVVDKSSHNQPLTVSSLTLDSVDTKFTGYRHLDLLSGGHYVRTTNSSVMTFGTGDFTIEGWINVPVVDTNTNNFILDTTGSDRISLGRNGQSSPSNGALTFRGNSFRSSYATDTWIHVAISRSGTNTRTFYNGALQTTISDSNDYNAPGTIYIGNYVSPSGTYVLKGLMQSFRVTKGVARYTSSFTVPSQAFPNEIDY